MERPDAASVPVPSGLLPRGLAIATVALLYGATRLFPFYGWTALVAVTVLAGLVGVAALDDLKAENMSGMVEHGVGVDLDAADHDRGPMQGPLVDYIVWTALLGLLVLVVAMAVPGVR